MTKNIAIMDSVYEELVKHKGRDESFSEELMRIIGKRGHIMDLAGSWKMTDAEAEEVKSAIRRLKKSTTESVMRRVKHDRA